jgi:8-oxo-dGTP pyrophosphatase MutT (NUDIX family)
MEILKHYEPQSEPEKLYKSQMLELYEAKGQLAFLRKSLNAHFTASAWIINPETDTVLLIQHKKLNKWLQPGGHADGEVNLEKVARKEAFEETGLINLQLASNSIFDIDIHLIPKNNQVPEHQHYDVRFVYFCRNTEETQINSESINFQWLNIEDVKKLSNEPSVLRMVEKSKSILDEK